MNRVLAALILLALGSGLCWAQGNPTIGMYADPDYVICYGDLELYIPMNIYFAAWLPPEIPAMTACEFSVDNLPAPTDVLITPTWTTSLVIGSLDWDISLAWATGQPGPWVLIGTVQFLALEEVGLDYMMYIVDGQDCLCLVVVDDDFNEHDAIGGRWTFNCSDPENCACWIISSPAESSSWGAVKSLY